MKFIKSYKENNLHKRKRLLYDIPNDIINKVEEGGGIMLYWLCHYYNYF